MWKLAYLPPFVLTECPPEPETKLRLQVLGFNIVAILLRHNQKVRFQGFIGPTRRRSSVWAAMGLHIVINPRQEKAAEFPNHNKLSSDKDD